MKKFQIYMILESTDDDGEIWEDTGEYDAVFIGEATTDAKDQDLPMQKRIEIAVAGLISAASRILFEEDEDGEEEG